MAETFDPHCVWFVGAGPGDRELITLKGYRLLQQAQVVIYAGSLINTELLAYCPPQAECHDSAALHLEQILDLMEAGVKAGKNGGASADGRRLAIWLGARAGRRADPPRDPLAGGAGRQPLSSARRRSWGWSTRYPKSPQSLIITRLEGRTPVPAREPAGSLCQPSNLDGDLPVGATYSPGGGAAGGGRLPRDHPGPR
ncbi:cobalt-precorrin-4 C(11)-methyltransferase [Klebsiella pneumoniae]|uniref:Cobalt-precorrin-4 C(11)-methyltransferase n=1 Tax=Klebsiella pneumoniae TaxID=573 RepID=A0A447RQ96_KLEPN|nr:cobalt-precorrin-4 C(11)-methyltransferase [Klebsiella pneumoniae]